MHDFDETGRTHRRTPPPALEVAAPDAATASSPAIATNRAALSPAAILGLQRSAGNASVVQLLGADDEQASPVHDVVGGGGSPLDAGVRGEMEGRFGQDSSDVRVHTDKQASDSAESILSRAAPSRLDVRRVRPAPTVAYRSERPARRPVLSPSLSTGTPMRSSMDM